MDHNKKPTPGDLFRFTVEFCILFFMLFAPSFFLHENLASVRSMIFFISLSLLQITILLVVMKSQKGITLKEFGFSKFALPELFASLLLWILLLGTIVLLSIVYSWCTGSARFTESVVETRSAFQFLSGIILLLVHSISIGYKEEIFFRSYILTRSSQLSLHPVFAICIGSILFGTGHLYQGIFVFLLAFLQGLVFSVYFLRKGNLHILAIAHSLYNFSVFVGYALLN